MKSNSKIGLVILIYAMITTWLWLYNSELIKDNYGGWVEFNINEYLLLTLIFVGLLFIIALQEMKHIKSAQSIEDAIKYNQLYKLEKEIVLEKLTTIQSAAKQTRNLLIYSISNDIINDFYSNLNLLNIKDYPEMLSVLHNKITEFKLRDNIHIDLEVENSISNDALLDSNDVIEIFELVVGKIIKKYNGKSSDKKVISLLIREEDTGVIFEFVYELFTLINIGFFDMLFIASMDTKIGRLIKKNKCTIEEIRPDSFTCIIRICIPNSSDNNKKKLKLLA